ncbi:hypothetical protein RE428_01760 [Marinobacter nanhaiticus D15-8W]|uniref:DUF3185 family protein n=1 Tax=Marinobacter nanhaiticus D15-8W TaxID=626887 RepID=N6X263_9GAMM|nr:DUF3185 family protein [Marinobacter nanhaiticus]ENO15143.1 DUF3185 family protein [Marinobacter nanhaiticus D15-8W]BES69158.1 hypothetical protein RE428_01760 [Marinobacter nanhaiticus D15-8W]
MTTTRLIGLVALVIGVLLLYFGWQSTQSVGEQLSESLTGRFSDETMWYLIGGAAAAIGGAFMVFVRN